jgi:hypothetical protein
MHTFVCSAADNTLFCDTPLSSTTAALKSQPHNTLRQLLLMKNTINFQLSTTMSQQGLAAS